MSAAEVVLRELDSEFENQVAQMKPLFLMMTSTFDQHIIALWMKKLYEVSGSSVTEKKNRNLYAKALFEMVQKRRFDDPFLDRPHSGPLPPLPTNTMVLRKNHENTSVAAARESNGIPDWLSQALPEDFSFKDSTSLSIRSPREALLGHQTSDMFRQNFEVTHKIGLTDLGINLDQSRSQNPLKFSAVDDFSFSTIGDPSSVKDTSAFNEEAYFRNIDLFSQDAIYPTTLHKEFTLPVSTGEQMNYKMRDLERTFKEKVLLLEGRHDSKIKEILERKNSEIQRLDEQHKKRYNDALKLKNLEVLQLQQLSSDFQKQLKNKDEEYKRFQDKVLEEKLELESSLEQKHAQNLEQHRETMSLELRAMAERERKRAAEGRDLDLRLQQLTADLKTKDETFRSLETFKEELSNQNKRLQMELAELKSRCLDKDSEFQMLKDAQALEVKLLRQEMDSEANFLQQENQLKLDKAAETISGLERETQQLKKTIESLEQQHQLDLKIKESENKQARQRLEDEHRMKVKSLQQQLKDQEDGKNMMITKLEQSLRDSEDESRRLAEELAKNMLEMQRNIDENEQRTRRLCDDWKQEIEKEKTKMKTCKQKRLKQEEDYRRQLDESSRQHQQEVAGLNVRFEQEKSQLMQDFHHQREQLRKESEATVARLQQTHRKEVDLLETRTKEAIDLHTKMISSKDENLRQLCEEIVQFGVARDEERKRTEQQFSSKVSQLESELKELHRRHTTEVEKLADKNNRSSKRIESECNAKIAKANQVVDDLHINIEQLKDELKRQKVDYENQLTKTSNQFEADQRHSVQQSASHINELKKEIDDLRMIIKKQDRLIAKHQLDEEEKIVRIRSQYEDKLMGRLPVTVQKEMEDTIAALKSQISSQKQILNLHASTFSPSRLHQNVGHLQSSNESASL